MNLFGFGIILIYTSPVVALLGVGLLALPDHRRLAGWVIAAGILAFILGQYLISPGVSNFGP